MLVAEVRFDAFGFAYIDVYIRAKNTPAMAYLQYKVDTGANRTTISREFLQKLGYGIDWIRESGELLTDGGSPTVATGEPIKDCYIVTLDEITIGDYVGYNWPFLTSLSVQFRSLLGTDTMQFFNWDFNYEHGNCHYELIPGKRKLLFNQKEQSIHSIDEKNNA